MRLHIENSTIKLEIAWHQFLLFKNNLEYSSPLLFTINKIWENWDNYDITNHQFPILKFSYSFINYNSCFSLPFHTVSVSKDYEGYRKPSVSRLIAFEYKLSFVFQNGFKTSHSFNILVRSQHNLLFLWSGFKHIGDNHYFEIDATSKEIMSFHDHGVVVLWLVDGRNT